MKKKSRKELIVKKALDSLKKQALRDDEIRKLKGGTQEGGEEAHVDGQIWPWW